MTFVERNDYDLIGTRAGHEPVDLPGVQIQPGLDHDGHDGLRRLRQPPRRVPGLHEPLHLPRAPPGHPGPLHLRLHLTGPNAENTAQSEASHAWVELYLPGARAGRVSTLRTASSRRPTTCAWPADGATWTPRPPSGTIYVGGGPETLTRSTFAWSSRRVSPARRPEVLSPSRAPSSRRARNARR